MPIADLFEKIPLPPVAKLLGWTFAGWDADRNEITVRFTGTTDFLNPAGFVQGGILTAMVDDTMGPAVLAASGGTKMCQSIDIHSHFLRPVLPGPVTCRARVVRLGRQIAFLEAELFDDQDRLCLRAASAANLAAFP